LVDEVELRDRCAPSRFQEVVRLKRSSPLSPDPRGVVLPYEACRRFRSRYVVTAPAMPFRRLRGFPETGFTDAEAPATSLGLDPLQGTPYLFRRGSHPPATFLEFSAPTATWARRSTVPGFPPPVCSAFRVSHPPDGFLPPSLSGHEDRCHSWGSPFRAFPPHAAVRLSAPVPSCRF
jgi:hypothetical protein